MKATSKVPASSLFILSPIASKASKEAASKAPVLAKVSKGEVSAITLFANRVAVGDDTVSKDNIKTAKDRLARVEGVGAMDLSSVFAAGALRMRAPSFVRVDEAGNKSVASLGATAPESYVNALRFLASL